MHSYELHYPRCCSKDVDTDYEDPHPKFRIAH